MPWHRIEKGECDGALKEMESLIRLRRAYPQLRRGNVLWKHSDTVPRLVCYARAEQAGYLIAVFINADTVSVTIPGENVLYCRNLKGTQLLPGGTAVVRLEENQWKNCL
jgi:hypothetical protein